MCRRFGGAVREAGVMFILFAPLPYVDVTSAWRFPSKWQRIATSAAGMYVELLVAAIAAVFIWLLVDEAEIDDTILARAAAAEHKAHERHWTEALVALKALIDEADPGPLQDEWLLRSREIRQILELIDALAMRASDIHRE